MKRSGCSVAAGTWELAGWPQRSSPVGGGGADGRRGNPPPPEQCGPWQGLVGTAGMGCPDDGLGADAPVVARAGRRYCT